MITQKRSPAEVRRKLAEIRDERLPEIIRDLKLRAPDDLNPILAGLDISVKGLSGGDRSTEADLDKVFFATCAFDETYSRKGYPLTQKAGDLMTAARDNRGHNGLKQALTGLIEGMKLHPEGLPDMIEDAHSRLKAKASV